MRGESHVCCSGQSDDNVPCLYKVSKVSLLKIFTEHRTIYQIHVAACLSVTRKKLSTKQSPVLVTESNKAVNKGMSLCVSYH